MPEKQLQKQKNNLKSQLKRLPANSTSLLQQFHVLLANKEDISLNTRKKVQALAKKLHYYPNPIAIVLKQQHTKRASA